MYLHAQNTKNNDFLKVNNLFCYKFLSINYAAKFFVFATELFNNYYTRAFFFARHRSIRKY